MATAPISIGQGLITLGGIAGLTDLWQKPTDLATTFGTATTGNNETHGTRFFFVMPVTVTGLVFYYPDNTARNVKVSLWDNAGTNLATTTASYNSTGLKTVTFGSPVTISQANCYKFYFVSVYATAANFAWRANTTVPLFVVTAASPQVGGPAIVWTDWSMWQTGDASPIQGPVNEYYLVYPTFTVP